MWRILQSVAMPVRDVLIVGAGPSGLATAIAAKHFGLDYVVLEQGSLVDAIRRFPLNMVFFTTPELMEIGGSCRCLSTRRSWPFTRRQRRPARSASSRAPRAA
jgi:glycine/D-amino acid oxidase-like deaminating enzyme